MNAFDQLVEIMARLRAPGGCPWDREQDHRSIRKYVIEEAYEVAEAIDEGSPAHLCAELGDLLLQVVFHAQMAREAGAFDIEDVCRAITEKMRRRHPHVFGRARREMRPRSRRTGKRSRRASGAQTRPRSTAFRARFPACSAPSGSARRPAEPASTGPMLQPFSRSSTRSATSCSRRSIRDVRTRSKKRSATSSSRLPISPASSERNRSRLCNGRSSGSMPDFARSRRAARAAGEDLSKLPPEELDRRWRAAKAAVAQPSNRPLTTAGVMANHASAIKRHRQSVKRAERNQAVRTRVRTAIKKLRTTIASGDAQAAQRDLPAVARMLDKAVSKGVLPRNNASRRLSRLARSTAQIG